MTPLVPETVDLRGMPWMPLDTVRLIDSDLFALATGDEFKAAVALWCKSWSQQPAASLPSDDRILAHLSGAGGRWKKVKAMALRGWVACDDGRLYHHVLAEKALEAWEQREEYQDRQDNEKTRLQQFRAEHKALRKTLREHGIVLPFDTKIDVLRERVAHLPETNAETEPETKTFQNGNACNATAMAKTGTGTGIYQEQEPTSPHTSARSSRAGASNAASGVCEPEPSPVVLASIELRKLGLRITPQHPDLIASIGEGVTVAALTAMAEAYPGKPAGYVINAARRQHAEGATPISTGPPHAARPAAPSKTRTAIERLQALKIDENLSPRLAQERDPRRLEQADDAQP